MYVMSSATERCLMTAQSFLAGFLPPNHDDQRHLLPINWQPVAINSVPRDRDRVKFFLFLFWNKIQQHLLIIAIFILIDLIVTHHTVDIAESHLFQIRRNAG